MTCHEPDNREVIFSARRKDFKFDWFSGSGAGGQHRNKHQNCLRLTHIPSGLTTTAQTARDRPTNQRNAFSALSKMLIKHYVGEEARKRYPGQDVCIRTYHEPDNRVTDHASGEQRRYSAVVVKGDLTEMIECRRLAMAGEAAANEVAS